MSLKLVHMLFVLLAFTVILGFANWGLRGEGAQLGRSVQAIALVTLVYAVCLVVYGFVGFRKLLRLKGPAQ